MKRKEIGRELDGNVTSGTKKERPMPRVESFPMLVDNNRDDGDNNNGDDGDDDDDVVQNAFKVDANFAARESIRRILFRLQLFYDGVDGLEKNGANGQPTHDGSSQNE